MRLRPIGEWIFILAAVLALAGSGLHLLPRARTAARLLAVAEDPPAIAAIRLAPVLTPERVGAEIDAAITVEDDDLAQSFLDLADARGVPVDSERRVRVTALRSGATYRAARAFAAGAATGEAETAAGLAGVLAADLSGLGDIRDIAREGPVCVRGEACDALVLGLATVGLATNAATIASAGVATPLRAGVTILKTARKLGRLTEPLAAASTGMVRAAVDPDALRALVRAGGRLDAAGVTAAARSAVRPEALRGLRALGGNVYGLYTAAGPRGVLQVLGIARSPGEIARAERLALRFGTRTRATLKLLDRAALVLGRELTALGRTLVATLAWALGVALICRRLGTALGRLLWRRAGSVRRHSTSGSVARLIFGWPARRIAHRLAARREGLPQIGGLELPGLLTPTGSRRVSDPDPAQTPTPAPPTLGRYEPTLAGAATVPHDGVTEPVHPGAGVRVVALGGPLPVWAVPTPAPLAQDETEVVVLHGPGSCEAAPGEYWSNTPVPRLRIVVGDGVRADQPRTAEGPTTIHVGVSTTPGDRDAVARVVAACAHGSELIIGTDAGDLRRAAGVEPSRPGSGRAIVIPALADAELAARVGTAVAELTAAGYDGGRLMVQLVTEPDSAALDLAALDACAAAVLGRDADRDWVLSCAVADRTALVIVAFDRPTPALAEYDPGAARSSERVL